MQQQVLRSRALDRLCVELWEDSTPIEKMRLTPKEMRLLKKPQRLAAMKSLDEKLMIASKLNKRIYIVMVNKDSDIDHIEFAKMFRQTFIDEQKNKEAIELMDAHGLVVCGNETVSRFLQKAELFMNSDYYEVAKVIHRMKNRKASVGTVLSDKEYELKTLFMHTILRMHFATFRMKDYLKMMAMNEKEFAILAVLFLTAKPMLSNTISDYISKVIMKKSEIYAAALSTFIQRTTFIGWNSNPHT